VSPATLSTRQKALGAWIAICVIWGTTYLGIRVTLETMPPFLMAAWRWIFAGALMIAALRARRVRMPAVRDWPAIATMALLMLVLGNGAVTWAEQYVASGLTAVIIASNPFWMVGIESALGGDRLTGRAVLGLAIGFAGVALLVWPEIQANGGGGERFAAGVVALQIACVGWALGSSWSKRHSQHADILGVTALQMMFAGIMLLLIGTVAGEWSAVRFSTRSTVAFVYLTTVGSIAGYVAYAYALKHLPMAIVSLYAYFNPIIAVVLGVLLLGEPFDSRMGVAAAIVLAGVAVVRGRQQVKGAGGGSARRQARTAA
jgi:drug/metabolite transporter (DMT)-like permease